ncbi:thy-1 membrane glycoprotein [Astyanax mexicanus]|uniref:thy-1 membrane glycoprotein n=1 Tax=Astyanax mexicanus TaxID=7994 RepID=UPI0020CB54F0|nr:thy-1 membrane glycoprotein [Astyanax mexicanus]
MRLLTGQISAVNFVVWNVVLAALISPVFCDDNDDDDDNDDNDNDNDDNDHDDDMTVCQEEDNDLRVTCPLRPTPDYHTQYEFSMSRGSKEIIINTNVSGTMPEPTFRHNTYVEELQPYGFKLTMMRFTLTENTTFMCKVSKEEKRVFVDLDSLQPCSAISLFLQSYPWLLTLLLPLAIIQLLEAL